MPDNSTDKESGVTDSGEVVVDEDSNVDGNMVDDGADETSDLADKVFDSRTEKEGEGEEQEQVQEQVQEQGDGNEADESDGERNEGGDRDDGGFVEEDTTDSDAHTVDADVEDESGDSGSVDVSGPPSDRFNDASATADDVLDEKESKNDYTKFEVAVLLMRGYLRVLRRVIATQLYDVEGKKDGFITGHYYPSGEIKSTETVKYAGIPEPRPVQHYSSRMFVFTGVALAIVFLGGFGDVFIGLITPDFVPATTPPYWGVIPLLFIGLGVVIHLRETILRASTWHVITDSRVILRKNVLFTETKMAPISQVTNVSRSRKLPDKWFNLADIEFYTAGTDESELEFDSKNNADYRVIRDNVNVNSAEGH